MKCPFCHRAGRTPVRETRQHGDDLLRRRECGHCGRFFVSKEFTTPDLRIPRPKGHKAAPRLQPIRSTAAHLQALLTPPETPDA